LTVAYLANEFPCAVEPYVGEEIAELRRRGITVIACSVRRPSGDSADVIVEQVSCQIVIQALWLCGSKLYVVAPLLRRVLLRGGETPWQRLKALAHTFLGACYGVMLQGRGVEHIHVHHGYFGSWIAMTAARLLGIPFSMTLHGSDLLLHGNYLDVKLANCAFCFTISEYNRNFILQQYPSIDSRKLFLARLGVKIPEKLLGRARRRGAEEMAVLAVGRLHPVKDHAFLVRACAQLLEQNVGFKCYIAGSGPERRDLTRLISDLHLEDAVTLLGHVPREELDVVYDSADVLVLTSRSEGIPLVLMEAMARGMIVLAPAITGIPELVIHRSTGFLYEPGSVRDFVTQLLTIRDLVRAGPPWPRTAEDISLDSIRESAVAHVRQDFNRPKNLEVFADLFTEQNLADQRAHRS
jgi:colanic acid/amylovoran biosynthesis glycosyltransferase